ncbi:MAG: late competence development ComFB family protein [Gammaproteobacteria bacterium]
MPFDSISNYYEQLVIDSITKNVVVPSDVEHDDFLQDIACVALNKLPARYIRHNVDMIFYTKSDERDEMLKLVDKTVKEAFNYVLKHHPKKTN